MYSFIAITLLLLFSVVAVLLYLQTKTKRLHDFKNGKCPNCGAVPTTFYDKEKNITIKKEPIKVKLLKNNGCSGGSTVQYACKECDIKEVFDESGNCGI